jgi:hypothetical protein
MAKQFNNTFLSKAAEEMRNKPDDQSLLKVCRALLDTKVLVPATWDKEPVRTPDGMVKFEPDTRISIGMITTKDNAHRYVPVYTSAEQIKNQYGNSAKSTLLLSLDQIMPFLNDSNGQLEGIVVDPAGSNIPFQAEFLKGLIESNKKTVSQNTIRRGQSIHLKNPEKNNKLEAALISAGFHEPALRAIYLKERVEDPENPENTHWFVVLDSDELDTAIINRVGAILGPQAGGKEMEFIFTDQKLGQDVARTSKPIYTRM